MENIVKTWLALFLMLSLIYTGIGIIGATINTKNATGFADACASSIQTSKFTDESIIECENKAAENGYSDFMVKKYDMDNDGVIDTAQVSLTYKYEIPFLNIVGDSAKKTIRAYSK